ncbi:YopX family protein [Virgibacillus proomii]|uniref:YopX family protein n=1 Tax=Virgibacillus proomii TaxID=84407 RepID=UPI000987AE76|nr:YopX family protein [Virgibacillus proomii]
MSDIKIRYIMKHKPSGNVHVVYYSLSQIEQRPLKDLSIVFSDEHEMLSRDIYTGLKDKNGKEIYEGDKYHMGDPNITYTVVWHDAGFVGKQNGASSYAGLTHWQERIEVVGNIYEGDN